MILGLATGCAPSPGGGLSYWRVANVEDAAGHRVAMGASILTPPFGNTIGRIENPHFELPRP
jgi:hypothetical protein